MTDAFSAILKRLEKNEMILPTLQNQLLADDWPDSYTIDSGPYYGLNSDGTPDGYFHPSSHPMLGARELYYRFHPDYRDLLVPERTTSTRTVTLGIHSAAHAMIQTQMLRTGLVRKENVEWEYRDEVNKVRGRIDFIFDHSSAGPLVVEFKGQNPYHFRKLESPKPAWEAQLSLGLDNYGTNVGVLLVMEMSYPFTFKEFRVEKNTALLEEIYAKFRYVREAIKENKPPRHCCAEDSDTANKCEARFQCWKRAQE